MSQTALRPLEAEPPVAADALQQTRAAFFDACKAHLVELERGLNALFKGEADPERVDAIHRASNAIRGAAGIFRLDDVAAVTRTMQDILSEAGWDPAQLTGERLLALLRATEDLARLIRLRRVCA